MKSDVTGKPSGTDLEKPRALTDVDIVIDAETPYDPNDPVGGGAGGGRCPSDRDWRGNLPWGDRPQAEPPE